MDIHLFQLARGRMEMQVLRVTQHFRDFSVLV